MSKTDTELIFNMDEGFECPETFRGHEIVSYMQLGYTEWFNSIDFQCIHADCPRHDVDSTDTDWTDETYAMFTSDTAIVPCTRCGKFSFFEVKPHRKGISLRRKR